MAPSPLRSPPVGLGTWKLDDPDACATIVANALEIGYRHVDTAQLYGNEAAVGSGIREASVDRSEVSVASKVWFDNLGYDAVVESTKASLDRLGLEYVDIMYVHWPAGEYDPETTLAAFAALREAGLVRHVGVSNFTPALLSEARAACPVPIVANQVEMHPLLQQQDLRAYCEGTDVSLVAYSPFVHGDVFDIPELQTIAESRGVRETQVTLAWFRAKNVLPIPKTARLEHLRDNWASQSLQLTDEELDLIDGIERERRISDAEFAPDW